MALFGWCLPTMADEQHEGCKTEFEWQGLPVKCECVCHEQERKETN
jgi:hypothetical protein